VLDHLGSSSAVGEPVGADRTAGGRRNDARSSATTAARSMLRLTSQRKGAGVSAA